MRARARAAGHSACSGSRPWGSPAFPTFTFRTPGKGCDSEGWAPGATPRRLAGSGAPRAECRVRPSSSPRGAPGPGVARGAALTPDSGLLGRSGAGGSGPIAPAVPPCRASPRGRAGWPGAMPCTRRQLVSRAALCWHRCLEGSALGRRLEGPGGCRTRSPQGQWPVERGLLPPFPSGQIHRADPHFLPSLSLLLCQRAQHKDQNSERLEQLRAQLQIILYLYKKGMFSKRHTEKKSGYGPGDKAGRWWASGAQPGRRGGEGERMELHWDTPLHHQCLQDWRRMWRNALL